MLASTRRPLDLVVRPLVAAAVAASVHIACSSSDAPEIPPAAACTRWTGATDNGWAALTSIVLGGRLLPRLVPDPKLALLSADDMKRVADARRVACEHMVTVPGSNLTAAWLESCHAALVNRTNAAACVVPAGRLAEGEKVTAFYQCTSMTLSSYYPDADGRYPCGVSPGLGGACPGIPLYPGTHAVTDCGYGLHCDDHMICPPHWSCSPGDIPNTCVAAPPVAFEEPSDAGPPPPPPPPPPVVKLGELCLGATCEPGSYCRFAPGGASRCAARLPVGASCADLPSESCLEGSYCEYCGGSVAGQCQPPTPTCVAERPVGGSCASDHECGSRVDPLKRCEPTCKPGQENACVLITESDTRRLLAPGELGPSWASCAFSTSTQNNPCVPCQRLLGHHEPCDINSPRDDESCGFLEMRCRFGRCQFDWE